MLLLVGFADAKLCSDLHANSPDSTSGTGAKNHPENHSESHWGLRNPPFRQLVQERILSRRSGGRPAARAMQAAESPAALGLAERLRSILLYGRDPLEVDAVSELSPLRKMNLVSEIAKTDPTALLQPLGPNHPGPVIFYTLTLALSNVSEIGEKSDQLFDDFLRRISRYQLVTLLNTSVSLGSFDPNVQDKLSQNLGLSKADGSITLLSWFLYKSKFSLLYSLATTVDPTLPVHKDLLRQIVFFWGPQTPTLLSLVKLGFPLNLSDVWKALENSREVDLALSGAAVNISGVLRIPSVIEQFSEVDVMHLLRQVVLEVDRLEMSANDWQKRQSLKQELVMVGPMPSRLGGGMSFKVHDDFIYTRRPFLEVLETGLTLNPYFVEFFNSKTAKRIFEQKSSAKPSQSTLSIFARIPDNPSDISLHKAWLAVSLGQRIRDRVLRHIVVYHHQRESQVGEQSLKNIDQVNSTWEAYSVQIHPQIPSLLANAGLYFQLLSFFSTSPE